MEGVVHIGRGIEAHKRSKDSEAAHEPQEGTGAQG